MSTPDFSLPLDALRYESLFERPSKVGLGSLGRPSNGRCSFDEFLDGLPAVLAVDSLKQLRDAIIVAYSQGRQVLAGIGGHVIKTGCGPYLNDWIRAAF